MGKRKQDLGDVPMSGTKDDDESDDVSTPRCTLPDNF